MGAHAGRLAIRITPCKPRGVRLLDSGGRARVRIGAVRRPTLAFALTLAVSAASGLAAGPAAGSAPVDAPAGSERDLLGPPPPGTDDLSPSAIGPAGSAFEIPAADRSDPYGPRPSGVPKLTLAQIIRFALQNPAVQAASEDVEAMRAQLRKAKIGARLPMITTEALLSPGVYIKCDDVILDNGTTTGFDFQYCRSSNNQKVDVQTVKGYFHQLAKAGVRFQMSADILQPIYTFGKIKNLQKAAEAAVAIEKVQKLQVEQETILRVYQAHTALLLARESEVILREAKDIVDKARTRVEADLGGDEGDWDVDPDEVNAERDPDDLFKVQLAELEIEQMMREALKIESLALSALWALGGKAAPPHFDVSQDRLLAHRVDGGLETLAEYKSMAARHRPEARMAAAGVQARQAQERLARANFLPDLGVAIRLQYAVSSSADAQMSTLYYQDNFNYSRATAALALRWKWDFWNAAYDLQNARAVRRSAEYQAEAARLLLGRDVEQAYGDLVEAIHQMAAQRQAVDLSWKLVVSGQQKDSVGGGDAEKLLRVLESWYSHRFDYAKAIGSHNDALSRLSRAVGTQLATPP